MSAEPMMPDRDVPEIEGLEILDKAGTGGMATVYHARQTSLGRDVAVKVLHGDQSESADDVERFRAEARSIARLHHHSIIQVYNAFHRDGRFYFMMEYVGGQTLAQKLKSSGKFDGYEALTVAATVADALGYAWTTHELVHLDIKPDNIMYSEDGEIKITDFGLARSIRSIGKTSSADRDGYVFGTPAYMSPEQAMALPSLSAQSDMYALGATLYHLTTGKKLFEGRPEDEVLSAQVSEQDVSPAAYDRTLTQSFCNLLEVFLAKNPDDRFATWDDARNACLAVRNGLAFPATGVNSTIMPYPD